MSNLEIELPIHCVEIQIFFYHSFLCEINSSEMLRLKNCHFDNFIGSELWLLVNFSSDKMQKALKSTFRGTKTVELVDF